ncbi:helix-turn-helix transcriptional regulator [Nocardia colli]|uniref:Helix-turn-helix transcriptional regulator n=1 Tax=Nocardia colli TaxID=2545717 RepID=A0A5N0EDE0_9NOCA|nr:helix-turn-helix transcriptional regulator [Nocardia colli]
MNSAGICREFSAVIGGLQTSAIHVRHGSTPRIIRVLLSPLGARAVLGVRAAELVSGVFGLPEIIGHRGDELVERCAGADGWLERFDVLDDILSSGLHDRHVVPMPLQHAWARGITVPEGAARVDAVARDVGFSRRHLTELFAAEFGLTPKLAMRVARLDRARCRLQTRGESLSAAAAACGYADQAHLTREWRKLTAATPAAWIAAEHLPNVQDLSWGVHAGLLHG